MKRKSKFKKILLTKNNSFIKKVKEFELQSQDKVKIIKTDKRNMHRYTSSHDFKEVSSILNSQNLSFG